VPDLATTVTFFQPYGFLKALCSLSRIGESSEWISFVLLSGMLMKEIALWSLIRTCKGFLSHADLRGTSSTPGRNLQVRAGDRLDSFFLKSCVERKEATSWLLHFVNNC